jgi:hypothetical protein
MFLMSPPPKEFLRKTAKGIVVASVFQPVTSEFMPKKSYVVQTPAYTLLADQPRIGVGCSIAAEQIT